MKNLLLLCLLSGLSFCSFGQPGPERIGLRDYYFPYKKMIKKPLSYVFRNAQDSNETFTWQIQTQVRKKDTLLIIHVTNSKNDPVEESVNRISKTGANIISYKTFSRLADSIISFTCQIKDSATFGFYQAVDDQIRWGALYNTMVVGKDITYMKTRVFKGYVDPLKAMKFEDNYYYTDEDKEILDHRVKAYYRKDTGLVRYSVIDNKGISKLYILDE